jgi:hypothetical protein
MKWMNEKKRNGFFVSGENYKLIDRETLAYVAGLFDGEGNIAFQKNGKSSYIRVTIVNTDRAIVEYVQGLFGGTVTALKRSNPKWKPSWHWILTWSRAIYFLEGIRPWIRIKTGQIDVAMQWSVLRPGSGQWRGFKTKARNQEIILLKAQLKWLNHRGSAERGPEPMDQQLPTFDQPARLRIEGTPMPDRSY